MKLDNIFNEVISEQDNSMPKTSRNKQLSDAIVKRHPITFYYSGPRKPKKKSVKAGYRVKAEAVALGLNKKGNLVVRAWIDNPSKSKRGTPSNVGNEKANYGWRTFLVTRMSGIQVLTTETFDVPREKFNGGGDDQSMSTTYVSTSFGNKVDVQPEPETKPELEPQAKPEPKKIVTSKPQKKPGITKQTRSFDNEITIAQNDLAKVVSDMASTNEKYQKIKDTPEAEPLLNTLKDLTKKKKDLIKKVDDLINQFAISGVDADKVKVQKFQSANRAIKNEPEINIPVAPKKPTKKPNDTVTQNKKEKGELPEPTKKEKPNKNPDDNRYDLSENFVNRVKTLISYF